MAAVASKLRPGPGGLTVNENMESESLENGSDKDGIAANSAGDEGRELAVATVAPALEIERSLGELTALIKTSWESVSTEMGMIGDWLEQIRDRELYRPQYETFKDYCEAELPFKKRRANQLIEVSAVAKELCVSGQESCPNDWQLQELAKVPEGNRAAVLAAACAAAESENRRLTARHIREAAIPFLLARYEARRALAPLDDFSRLEKAWRKTSIGGRRAFMGWVFNKGGMNKVFPGWQTLQSPGAPDGAI